jgi:transcriptional regulator of acetoin/glycerol metabolism
MTSERAGLRGDQLLVTARRADRIEFFGYEDGAFTGGRAARRASSSWPGAARCSSTRSATCRWSPGPPAAGAAGAQLHPVGGARPIRFDARIVTATHRSLEARVAEGAVPRGSVLPHQGVRVCLPALRTGRPGAAHRGDAGAEANGEPVPRPSADALRALMAYPWPGNIRQLGNVLRLALTLAEDEGEITCEHLPEEVLDGGASVTHARRPADTRSPACATWNRKPEGHDGPLRRQRVGGGAQPAGGPGHALPQAQAGR